MKQNLKEIIADFESATRYILKIRDGRPYYRGNLDLNGTGITSLPEGLTVGGSLYLYGTGITSLPEGLTVGSDLDLYGTGITDTSNVTRTLSAKARKKISDARNRPITWKRDGREYVKVDGIFTVVDSHHGNVYRVHKLGSNKQLYLVTDGDNHWAHGDTLQEARTDLIYKINDRDTSMYEGMTLDDTLTFEEAIAAYRTITGACSPGTRDYIANRLPKPHKEKYSIAEIINLTDGEYGGEKFKEFFLPNYMKEETAKQAAELLHELDMLQDIKNATIKEESHWWGFIAPRL